MQNKGLIRLFATVFSIVCIYQLSFTWFAKNVEKDAVIYAESNAKGTNLVELENLEKSYLDSIANTPVLNLGFTEFTYNDVKEKEINLGLDLKGGINATLEVSVRDILIGLSNQSKNPIFNNALIEASKAQKSSDKDYLQLFFDAFESASQGSIKLGDPSIFGNKTLKDKINFQMTDDEVKPILKEEVKGSISTAFEVLRSRIDRFGVTQPNIQRIGESGRILIELPGARDIERVKKLLQSTAELQFWEVYTNQDLAQFFLDANNKLAEIIKPEKTETETDTTSTTDSDIDDLLGEVKDSIDPKIANPLFAVMYPRFPQNQNDISSIIASSGIKDTAKVNEYLSMSEIRSLLPSELKYAKFAWDAKEIPGTEVLYLYALKSNREDIAPIQGDVISDASQVFDQLGANPEVSMTMNGRGTKLWAKMTTENVGKFVAVVLDNYVYSAPVVNDAITTGRTSISGGSMTITEAQDLANALKSGKLPAAARIIESEVVGASLGQEAIESGTNSFAIALIIVLIWMIFYYGKAGIFSDIALALNILFIFGVLSSFGAVLTLPGIAGVVLTIGMAVDANVLIYERIKEELRKGKGLKEGINDGFSGALSSILDANITTLLTGIILYVFGTGPVKGFATTLIIGIITSLFSAIFITRLLIEWYTNKGNKLTFNTNITAKWFTNVNIDFLKKRKLAYVISGIILIAGIGSLATKGLNQGVDFVGGRTYTVRFENATNASDVASSLKDVFETSPEVKTYGSANQLKITTNFKIDDNDITVDDEVQTKLFTGLNEYLPDGMTYDQFKIGAEESDQKLGVMKYMKVGPTIADDIKQAALWAIIASLIVVFLYILLRFRKWQFSLGAVAAVFHDVLIVLSLFSVFYGILPFDMEIGQSFIAAILTVVGYSLNDTVVIFDRIREFANKHTAWPYTRTVNAALSSTLGRTINTSATTLIVLVAIFIFGGDSIKGFMFALIIGVIVGTYSSLFVASPIMYDTTVKLNKKVEK